MSVALDRVRGVLFGQAVGDALGFGTEFLSKADVARHYPHKLSSYSQIKRFDVCEQWRPGDWTDDTDQALCILDSLLENDRLDIRDIAARLLDWALADGFGMGSTVYAVVYNPDFVKAPHRVAREYWLGTGRWSAANGGLMRTSYLGVWDYHDERAVRENAEDVCRITHADPRCVGSCVAVCLLIRRMLLGEDDIPRLLDEVSADVVSYHADLADTFRQTRDSLESLDLDEGMTPGEENRLGYTLKTLAAALWALRHAKSFEEGVSAIIHEAGDADTNAAVAGSLLGARFGLSGIPPGWVEGLVHREALERRAAALLDRFDERKSASQ